MTLRSPGSAAETALKLEASAAKIAVAIGPRRPVEGTEVFMGILWMVVEWICPIAVVVRRRVYVGSTAVLPIGYSSTAETLCARERRCMKLGPRLVKVVEDW